MKLPPHNPKHVVPSGGSEKEFRTNVDRANSALDTIRYHGQPRMDEDTETLSVDLITDVLHLLHSEGIDVDQVLRSSKRHFEDEAGEPLSA